MKMKEVDNLIPVDPLSNDPRVQQAKTLLLEAISERQSGIKGLTPPDPKKKIEYHHLLEAFKEARGAPLWHPYIGSGVGRGALVELLDGITESNWLAWSPDGGTLYYVDSGEPVTPPEPHALISGHVIESSVQENAITGKPFCWALVDTVGGTFDVVLDPALVEDPPVPGQIVSGWFGSTKISQ